MAGQGPQTQIADDLHAMKYRGVGEDFREAMNRVAFGLKDDDRHYHELREILLDMRFIPGGRIQNAIGSTRQTTPYNCYVSGTISDSFVDGQGCIMDRAKEAAATMRMGGGIGYDFSTLRPRGEMIKKLQSQASGPVSFMRIFNEVCLATASSGHRRGAQMGVLRVDHPDIVEFIQAKQNPTGLTGFNVSVAVTDEFMEAALSGKDFELRWNGRGYATVDAGALWEQIMRSTYDWGEPGVLFIDTVNRMNNLWYCETIAATNPCGEQPLPPFGACLLGSFNLVKYLKYLGPRRVETSQGPELTGPAAWSLDLEQLRADIPVVVRAMDNVVDRARYPLAEQRAEAVTKRRMGIGVMGLANAVEAVGEPYGSPGFLALEAALLHEVKLGCYIASMEIARVKGPFPLFDPERYPRGEFVKELEEGARAKLATCGIRNSHLTSIAPTGTISMCADNVSSGIEPVFAHTTYRQVNTPDGAREIGVEDYGVRFLGCWGKVSSTVLAREHLGVLLEAQRFMDSAVSKTINMDSGMSWDQFKGIYTQAWEGGAKGCTTFNQDGKRSALLHDGQLSGITAACTVDLASGRRECA